MAEQWFVERADGKVDGPFHERQISADLLAGTISESLRIRQGVSGPWCSAARVRAIFQQLADEGWYVRALDETFGPFMPEKLLELSRTGELHVDAEIRQGTANPWKPAERVLSLWRTQKAPHAGDPSAAAVAQPSNSPSSPADPSRASTPPRTKWSTEPIRHYRLALESVLPTINECVAYERLLLANDESQPGSLVVNRANAERIGKLSPTNSQQLLLNCKRGASHVVLFSETGSPEVTIIICPPGAVAEDCRRYIDENVRNERTSEAGLPNIKT